jgi:hypothetical protein
MRTVIIARQVQWGTAAEWSAAGAALLAALATLVAALVALHLGRTQVHSLRDQIDQQHKDTQEAIKVAQATLQGDRERWQYQLDHDRESLADLVSCNGAFVWPKSTPGPMNSLTISVANEGPAVIFNVRVFVLWQGVVHRGDPLGSLAADANVDRGMDWAFPASPAPSPDACGVTFRDVAGRTWARWANGDLQEMRGLDPEDVLRAPGRPVDR